MIKLILIAFFISSSVYATSLKVAVAANVRFAFDEIATAYTKKSGIKIVPIVSSSGKLTAQIQHGAPFDLFMSANMKYPKYLYKKKLAVTKPKIYAYGMLVLWSLNKNLDVSLEGLKNSKIKKIAIPNPKTAPYGVQGLIVLKKYGLKKQLFSKIVFGESISQTNQYIYSHSADIGITAKSVVKSPRMSGKGKWIELDRSDYEPIKQGIVILKHGEKHSKKASLDFYNFIFSDSGQKILKKYGYIIP
jgi:molybdate transport system substrate-binding protein